MNNLPAHARGVSWRLVLACICGFIAVVPGIVSFGALPALPGIILAKLELNRLRANAGGAGSVRLARMALVMSAAGGAGSVLFVALGFFAGGLRLLER